MKNLGIAKIGYKYVILSGVLAAAFYLIFTPLFFVFIFITAFVAFFFRDPPRKSPQESNLVLAPADGKIMRVERTTEPDFIGGEALKISIFLSLFDVHINRAPCRGNILYCQYIPGGNLPAYKDKALQNNERNLIGIQSDQGKVLVIQMAGIIARRIVCWIKKDDLVEAGARIGMIKFGSCTEIYLPTHLNTKVKVGERVRGGETVLGEY